jgi:uncharacterized protein YbjT (DUF2867 family)
MPGVAVHGRDRPADLRVLQRAEPAGLCGRVCCIQARIAWMTRMSARRVVTASRHATALGDPGGQLHAVNGDASDPAAVDRVVRGHQAVIVTLGISENALRVRWLGSPGTPMDIRSRGTRNVIEAMRRHGVARLVVQTAYGVGATRDKLPRRYRLLYWLVLRPQIADTELQEHAVRTSGLDWVIVQPVSLTDDPQAGLPFASPAGELAGMKVSRGCVGRFLVHAVESSQYVGRSVAVSAVAPLPAATLTA